MKTLIVIASISTPALEWLFVNWPVLGLLCFVVWLGWKYYLWLDNRFTKVTTDFQQALREERVIFRQQMEDSNKNLNQRFDDMHKIIDLKFAAVDLKFAAVDQRFTHMDRRIDSIEKHIDSVEKRIDKIDDKLEIQNQINIKLFTLLDVNQKTIVLNR